MIILQHNNTKNIKVYIVTIFKINFLSFFFNIEYIIIAIYTTGSEKTNKSSNVLDNTF